MSDCQVTLKARDREPARTVEAHHMVMRDGVWTCLHCETTR